MQSYPVHSAPFSEKKNLPDREAFRYSYVLPRRHQHNREIHVSNLFLTLVIAFVIIVLALACLAIGWLVTGKTKLSKSSCGRDPTKSPDADCESVCNICSGPVETILEEDQEIEKEQKKEP